MAEKMMDTVVPGTYRHYKGKLYRVIGVGRHSETEEEFVIYQQLYGEFGLWIRPKEMFMEYVEVDGLRVPRFMLTEEPLSDTSGTDKEPRP